MSKTNGKDKPNIHTLAMMIRIDPDAGDLAIDPKVMVGHSPNNYTTWALDVMRAHLTRQALWVIEGLASPDLAVRKEAWRSIRNAVKDDGTAQSKTNLAYGDIMCSMDGKGDQGSAIEVPDNG